MTRPSAASRGVRFRAPLERSRNNLWGCHLRVPAAAADRLLSTGSRRVVCTLNGSATYQCALIPFGSGTFVITVNKGLRTKLGIDPGSAVEVHLKHDTSTYGLPFPGELAELLRQDREGKKVFDALTPGKKRTLLYIVGQAKTTELRIVRALTIVRHLKANNGVIRYGLLSSELRNSRRRVSPGG